MNPQHEDADQIVQFYSLIRDYQAEMSKSADGELSHINNFGYWLPSCANLYDAEIAFFDLIVQLLSPLNAGDQGVDIGCGIGGYAIRILQNYPVNLTCIDILEEHLAVTRRYAAEKNVKDRIDVVQCSSMTMECFEDNSLDFAYCIESSFHYDDKQNFFNEVCRVLKPGATFVYADISCEDISRITFKSGNFFSSKQELDDYIVNAGMKIVEYRDIAPQVYKPLKQFKDRFDIELLDESLRPSMSRVSKYWNLVLNNYIKLFDNKQMGYPLYKIQK